MVTAIDLAMCKNHNNTSQYKYKTNARLVMI